MKQKLVKLQLTVKCVCKTKEKKEQGYSSVAQLLPSMHKVLASIPSTKQKYKPGGVLTLGVKATQEAEAGGFQVPGQFGQYSKTPFFKNRNEKEKQLHNTIQLFK